MMWVCAKCDAENYDLMRKCKKCRSLRCPTGELAARSTSKDVLNPHPTKRLSKPVGVTRRFSVGTLMILTAVYAVLFSGLKMLGAGLPVFAGIFVFVSGVAVAQMFVDHGRSPRTASLLTGYFMGFVSGIIILALAALLPASENSGFGVNGSMFAGALLCVCGGPLGYVAGALIAGVFLVREREERVAEEVEEDGE
jgi:hypothetical protein